MKKTIIINDKPFEFDEKKTFEGGVAYPMDHDSAKELLIRMNSILRSHNLCFQLIFGTLLGAVREKDFIKGDEDIDIMIMESEEEKLRSLIPILSENGIKIFRAVDRHIYSFRIDEGSYLDVYITKPNKRPLLGLYYMNIVGYNFPKKLFKATQEIDFMGEVFLCPKDPVKFLRYWYGKTWNTPLERSKVDYPLLARCENIYRRVRGIIKRLFSSFRIS